MAAPFEFAIVGAGAIGSLLGAHLARAGHAVAMLARGERAAAVMRDGLRIRGLANFTQPVTVLADPADFRGARLLILATKAIATERTLQSLRHADVDAVFSIQNGLAKNRHLAAAWGVERVLGAVADTSGELLESGQILFTRNECLCIGEPAGGMSARARDIAATIDACGIRTSAVPDIESLEWSKFAAWCGLMVLALTMRTTTWRYLIDADAARVLVRLVRETASLASVQGIPLSDRAPLAVAAIAGASEDRAVELLQALGRDFRARAADHRMSALQDLEAGRPLEVEETLGHAVDFARRIGVPSPLLESAYPLVRAMDRLRGHADAPPHPQAPAAG